MYKVCYWDAEVNEQKERDATPEEAAEIEARKAAAPGLDKQKRIDAIKVELISLDSKRIRPMAEGDTVFLNELNAQAVSLREEMRQLISEIS